MIVKALRFLSGALSEQPLAELFVTFLAFGCIIVDVYRFFVEVELLW